MTSLQERLQLKRVPLDTWNTREQLCLASAVMRSGDQNWMSVSRSLKTVGEPNRPSDWYSQKSCAAQYGVLLENVETPKRKKRNSDGGVETPQESILKRLTQERIAEIQKNIQEMNQQYEHLKNEVNEARNQSTSEERLSEMWASIESEKRMRERETANRAAWMREREENRSLWRPPTQPVVPVSTGSVSPATTAPPSSPLLTSLLKSSPVVTTPQHITHPANVVETTSPSVTAPTLSMLLEKGGSVAAPPPHDNKRAAIEHIKSQLVQIEHQLKANSSPPAPLPVAPPTPALDIDDIEIKAEDVYAFSDIDLVIPPVASMHKGITRLNDKPVYKKDAELPSVDVTETQDNVEIQIDVKHEQIQPSIDEVHVNTGTEVNTTPETLVTEDPPPAPPAPEPVPEVKISFPEMKFPTPEIKFIQPEEKRRIKEDIKPPALPPEPIAETEVVQAVVPTSTDAEVVSTAQIPPIAEQVSEEKEAESEVPQENNVAEVVTEVPDLETIPLPPDPVPEETLEEVLNAAAEPPLPLEAEVQSSEGNAEDEAIKTEEEAAEVTEQQYSDQNEYVEASEDIKKEDGQDESREESAPQPDIKQVTLPEITEADVKQERVPETEDTHTETDDDTPMELSREEEKDGKKKRDYSRKKKPDSRTCSGSESAEASAPDSPSGCDAERQHRLWKKSVLLVYSRICAHKFASLFLRPITDEEAPGYSVVVKRPVDLGTIKRNIESGNIRTTVEFHRDILLMLSNALMYNGSEHSVYRMAKDMHQECVVQLSMLVAAQAHAGLHSHAHSSHQQQVASGTRKRRRDPQSPQMGTPVRKRPRE